MSQTANNRIIAVLFVGVLMGAMDISIVGPAIPSIQETIQVEQRSLGWIFSIYVLFNLVGISLFAKLSDRFGRRNIYMLAISVFTLGSLVVAVSPSMSMLLLGRAIQGFGASGIFPVASAVVGDLFPPEKRGSALGLIGAVFGIAFMIGPVLAGTLLAFFEWHVLFTINLPIAAVLLYASWRVLPNTAVNSSGDMDLPGILLLALLLVAFALGLNHIDVEDVMASLKSLGVWPFFVACPILAFGFMMNERRASNPVVKLSLFRIRQVRVVGLIALGAGLMQASFVFIPDYAVGRFNVTAARASFMLLPVVVATAIGSPVFGRMLDRQGSKRVVLLGLMLSGIGFFLVQQVMAGRVLFYFGGAAIGFGMSILMGSSLRYIMLNEVEAADRATTQGVLTLFIAIGQLTGSAIMGMITADMKGVQGYHNAFMSVTVLMIILVLVATQLRSREEELASIRG